MGRVPQTVISIVFRDGCHIQVQVCARIRESKIYCLPLSLTGLEAVVLLFNVA